MGLFLKESKNIFRFFLRSWIWQRMCEITQPQYKIKSNVCFSLKKRQKTVGVFPRSSAQIYIDILLARFKCASLVAFDELCRN